jgi:hypothetical protein
MRTFVALVATFPARSPQVASSPCVPSPVTLTLVPLPLAPSST